MAEHMRGFVERNVRLKQVISVPVCNGAGVWFSSIAMDFGSEE